MAEVNGLEFHRYAVVHHLERLVVATGESGGEMTDVVRLAAADALAWSFALREDVLRKWRGYSKSFQLGVRWARHRVVHGDAHLLAVEPSTDINNASDSPDIAFNDPEAGFDGGLANGWTVRFVKMRTAIPGDKHDNLRDHYNRAIAPERVFVVCRLLAGDL